jgi:hypothetical protein
MAISPPDIPKGTETQGNGLAESGFVVSLVDAVALNDVVSTLGS